MKGYRIALRRYGRSRREAFSGQSGFAVEGRWHSRGRLIDYAAESLSLATLERLVHYKRFSCLEPHVLFELDIPDAMIETLDHFPKGWEGDELSRTVQAVGNRWYDERRSPALLVPSAITPGESNLVINRHHPGWDWSWIVAGPRRFLFTPRLIELLSEKSK